MNGNKNKYSIQFQCNLPTYAQETKKWTIWTISKNIETFRENMSLTMMSRYRIIISRPCMAYADDPNKAKNSNFRELLWLYFKYFLILNIFKGEMIFFSSFFLCFVHIYRYDDFHLQKKLDSNHIQSHICCLFFTNDNVLSTVQI